MKSFLLKLIVAVPYYWIAFFKIIDLLLKKDSYFYIMHFLNENIRPTVNCNGIVFDASDRMLYARAMGLTSKEPETIHWIDNFFQPNETFYDIGANIGTFSLYAAKKANVFVVSFEPESANYYFLNRNIFLNKLHNRITAYNISVNDINLVSSLNLSEFKIGMAWHTFHITRDARYNSFVPQFKQGSIGMQLDSFIMYGAHEFPNHIKIDVDGNEDKVISGMSNTLKDHRLKTVSVEINTKIFDSYRLIDVISSSGFSLHVNDRAREKQSYPTEFKNLLFIRS